MTALDEIRKLYEDLPALDCKGLCWNACGPIDMSTAERERTVELGVDIPLFTQERSRRWANDERLYCPALSFDAREGQIGCSIYEDRPMICRIWGLSEGDLSCPHGCTPERRISTDEVYDLITETFRLGGHPDHDSQDLERAAADLKRLTNDPETAPLVKRLLAGDRSVEPAIRAALRRS